jgi:DNA-binding NtrC family response regulator
MDEGEARRAVTEREYALVVIDAGAVEEAAKLTAWLLATTPDLPIVVATASPTWQRARQVLKAGASDYIRKTLDEEKTRRELGAVLDLQAG